MRWQEIACIEIFDVAGTREHVKGLRILEVVAKLFRIEG
jgi:hypothetical protein